MPSPPSSKRPNVVVVMSDQHAADVLGCSGDPAAHTPHLDGLAQSAVRFANAYCNSPVCVPSRLSMITGKTPSQLEVWGLSDTIRSDELTWPTVLGAAGYQTAVSGRLHLWWPDKLLGFHERLCGDAATRVCSDIHEFFEPGTRREAVMANFKKLFLKEFADGTGPGEHPGFDLDRQATTCAVDYIHRYSRQASPAAPFALYVGFLCPHSPLRFPAQYYQLYSRMPVEVEGPDTALPPMLQTFARTTGFDRAMDPETARRAVRAYYAMVHFVDEQVGRLLEALRQTGLIDNTLIAYSSDHGEMLGRRGLWYKNQLLERSIRVPLILRHPQGSRSGSVQERLVSLLDLFPTLAEAAGAEPWPEAVGASLCPLLTGSAPALFDDRPVFCEYADYGIGQPAACIRQGNLKLLAARTYEAVLYDLERDPGETTDRSKDPAYAQALAQLQQHLRRYWDAEATYHRVVRNQKRIDLIRQSRLGALSRGQTLSGGITA